MTRYEPRALPLFMKWVQSPASTVPFEPQHRSNGGVARPLLWLTGIALLALALRIYQIGGESLWLDEWLSLRGAERMDHLNRHRPVFYLFLRGWLWFGGSDVWVRLPAVIFGTIGILLLFPVARRLADTSVALIACLIMAVAVPELDHSQEVRMYTMASALTLSSIYMLLVWVQQRKLWMLSLHLVLTYAAFLTTPTTIAGLIMAGGIATSTLLYRRRRTAALATIAGYAVLIASWWPLKRYAKLAIRYGSLSWIPRPSRSDLFSLHGTLLTDGLGGLPGAEASYAFVFWISLLALSLVIVALISALRGNAVAQKAAIVAVWFYSVIIGTYATSILKTPVWAPRYFHYAAPALYVLLSIGLITLLRWRRWAIWAAAIPLVTLMTLGVVNYYRLNMRADWRGIAGALTDESRAGDAVAVIPREAAGLVKRYYKGPARVEGVWPNVETLAGRRDALIPDLLQQIPPHSGRTWIVVRADIRLERLDFVELLTRHFRDQRFPTQVRSFVAVRGRLYLIDVSPNGTYSCRPTDEEFYDNGKVGSNPLAFDQARWLRSVSCPISDFDPVPWFKGTR